MATTSVADRDQELPTQAAAPTARSWADRSLVAVGLLGSADIGQFLATNSGMFTSAPGRAAGSGLGLALWLGLTGLAGLRVSGHSGPRLERGLAWTSGLLAVGSLGLVAIHAAAHVGGLRPAAGALLGVAAVGLVWAARR